MTASLDISLALRTSERHLFVEYHVANRCGETVLLFDRMMDFRSRKLDMNWGWVEIHDELGEIRRQWEPMPLGFHTLVPVLPVARRIAKHQELSESFALDLPLVEKPAYPAVLMGRQRVSVTVRALILSLGWVRESRIAAAHAGDQLIEYEQLNLVAMPSRTLAQLQETVQSAPFELAVSGVKYEMVCMHAAEDAVDGEKL
jgi:hypothetical protein